MSYKTQKQLIPLLSDQTVTQTSNWVDVRSCNFASITFTCVSSMDTDLVLVVQGSDDVPPNGFSLGMPSTGNTGVAGWTPTTFYTITDQTNTAMTNTMTSAGGQVNFSTNALTAAWLRVVSTPTDAPTGTISATVTLKDS